MIKQIQEKICNEMIHGRFQENICNGNTSIIICLMIGGGEQNQACAAGDWPMTDVNLGILLVIVKSNMLKRKLWKSEPQLVLIKRN